MRHAKNGNSKQSVILEFKEKYVHMYRLLTNVGYVFISVNRMYKTMWTWGKEMPTTQMQFV